MEADFFARPTEEAWFYVHDPEQAKLLADPKSLRYFGPFVGRERSAKAAAEELDISVALMLHYIQLFLQAGLLKVAHSEPRAGRAIKHYRAVSNAFFVPLEATPFADLEERLTAGLQKRQQLIIHNTPRVLREVGGEGRRIYRASNGTLMLESAGDGSSPDPLDDPSGPAAIDYDLRVNLTFSEAKALQQELYTVVKRYQQPDREGKSYLLALTLLPLAD